MDEQVKQAISAALGKVPSGMFILTAEHEDRRMGMVASWVQQACFEPPMISIAVAKGRSIMPLISESRKFALCQLAEDDRVILRKFARDPDPGEDPFLGFELVHGQLHHLPILAHALGYLECDLACHMDVEGDHDLFVGHIRGAGGREGDPMVHLRRNGFTY